MDVERVLRNIKTVDCPVDSLEEKIRDACRVPGMEEDSAVVVDRNEHLDKGELKAYNVHIVNEDAPRIVAMVREGNDGYVSTVMDAYTLE